MPLIVPAQQIGTLRNSTAAVFTQLDQTFDLPLLVISAPSGSTEERVTISLLRCRATGPIPIGTTLCIPTDFP
jgi:hypothetical protein